jgi:hypothetical protein
MPSSSHLLLPHPPTPPFSPPPAPPPAPPPLPSARRTSDCSSYILRRRHVCVGSTQLLHRVVVSVCRGGPGGGGRKSVFFKKRY